MRLLIFHYFFLMLSIFCVSQHENVFFFDFSGHESLNAFGIDCDTRNIEHEKAFRIQYVDTCLMETAIAPLFRCGGDVFVPKASTVAHKPPTLRRKEREGSKVENIHRRERKQIFFRVSYSLIICSDYNSTLSDLIWHY